MKFRTLLILFAIVIVSSACGSNTGYDLASPPLDSETSPAAISPSQTFTPQPTITFTASATDTPLPTETTTLTPVPTIDNLSAKVTVDKLTCRYGPGAEYLYLYALNGGAKIKLIGRTDANNWVWVDGDNKCWVNKKFLEIQGDPQFLPIVYPGLKLPASPYYPGPRWSKAERKPDGKIVITWEAVPISPGKYEDENMHQYIVEVWRCEGGQITFETLGTNFPFITVNVDETGCAVPSHGRVFVQEKHGYGGPVEIPWPALVQ